MTATPKPQEPRPQQAQARELDREELGTYARNYALLRLRDEQREAESLPALPLDFLAPEPPPRPGVPRAFLATEVSSRDEPEGRVRFRSKLWRLRSKVDVELNAETGELMAWRDPRPMHEQGARRIVESVAIEAAKRAVTLPPDCGSPDVTYRETAGVGAFEVVWVHLVGPDGDVIVEGDKVLVRVNATTGKVFSVFKKWRAVPRTPPA